MALTLKINDIEVTVPKGSTILEAAEEAGVFIPTLCHDKRIIPAGACRLCIVEDRKKPGQLIPSCFTPARDNMDIITASPAILDAVREQLNLILINHPLECPVCDKAGECELQNLVIRYGLTGAPYELEKAFRPIERESPLIERDMTRCVLCGRCVRICGELQGKNELEFLNRGYKTYIGTDGGRKLDCDFCGLCVSTCPVGALTDKLFKNTTRVWKLEKRRTVCSHCGLGCSVDLNMENNLIRRVTAPVHKDGKEGLLCARGRFGWRVFTADPRRLVGPQLRDGKGRRNVEWSEALSFTAQRISEVCKSYGGESLAAVTADLLTTEEASAYGRFFRSVVGSDSVASVQAAGYRRIMTQLDNLLPGPWKMASWDDLMAADILLVLGGGAAELHPVLKPEINRFLKGEGKELIVLSSWPDYFFARATLPLAVAPGLLDDFLSDLKEAFDVEAQHSHTDTSRYGVDTEKLARLISLLQGEAEITVLVVPDLYGNNDNGASLAASLHDRVRGILPLGGQFNSLGAIAAGFVSVTGRDFNDILLDIEGGRIRALYLLGEDPLEGCPDPARVRAALSMLDLLICQSPFATAVTELAHVVLPAALPPENEGSVISVMGARQAIRRVVTRTPGVRSDGKILQEIVRIMGREAEVFSEQGTSIQDAPAQVLCRPASPECNGTDAQAPSEELSPEFPFHLLPVPSLFGDSVLNRQSPEIEALRNGLTVVMGNDDFAAQGLGEKDAVEVRTPFGAARAIVRSSARVKRGTALLLHSAGSSAGLSLLRPGYAAVPAAIGKGDKE
ncbi:MAG: molybdopterin-dependent oxidoreductase [Syntrophales bacterium]